MPRWPEEEGGSPLDAVTVWNPRAHLATGDQTTRPADRPKPAAGSRSSPKDGLTDMSCRTKTLPTTSSGFTTSAGTRKLRPGLFFVSISEETYLSPIAKWSVKTWNREPVNHQLPHLHRYRRGSDRRNRSNPGRAPHSPSSPPPASFPFGSRTNLPPCRKSSSVTVRRWKKDASWTMSHFATTPDRPLPRERVRVASSPDVT